ncbi:hypothetical protein GCM10027404_33400 [Arthrobacter tumbae]
MIWGTLVKVRRAVVAGSVFLGMLTMNGCGVEADVTPASEVAPPENVSVGGYEGWWNSTPVSGDVSGLPDETITVRTDTGEIVDASDRDASGRAAAVPLAEVEYSVVPDPGWPEHSVVIIDAGTGEVIDSFPVDADGKPINQ